MFTATRIAAIVAALALGTTFLAVQVGGPDEAAPQPAAPTTDSWAFVTGTQVLLGGSTTDCVMTGRYQDMSDPRLEGDVCINYEEDEGGEDLATFWTSITVTNDDGSWQGQSVGFRNERGAHHHTGWLEGNGAYEGLAFVNQLTEANPATPSDGWNLDMVGLIYEGELPPMVTPDWTADMASDAE